MTGIVIGVVIDLAVGLLCVAIGLLLWKRRKLSPLHDYHYKNVKQEDIPAYARGMGIGLVIIGAGIGATGLLQLANTPLWWIPLAAGLLIGLTVLFKAQKKYNGSIMG